MSQVTKRALEASLKKLLLERPLDKITVTDIAEDCGINRMTFYYHFRDIYDLVEWACQEDARRILDGKRTYTTWQEGFRRILDGLIDNRPFILNVYRSVRREQVETFLFQVTHGLLMGVVEELDPRGEVREEDKAFLADFYKYAFVGLVLDWIRTGMKGEPAELARRVELVVDLQSRIMDGYNEQRLGTCMEVLCEGFDHNEGCYVGRTYADSVDIDGRVLFTAAGLIPAGEFVWVRITGVSDGDLTGEIEE